MRNAILSIAALVGLALTAGEADARWHRSYYRAPGYYTSPGFVYPGASYYSGYYPRSYYSGYYPGSYGNYYYQPRGLSISWSSGYGLRFGSGFGGYPGYGSIYSPWYGSSYYRGWRW
jgi:hypothetical protein